MRALLILLLTACSSSTTTLGRDTPLGCESGVLTVPAPASTIRAWFVEPPPTAHRCDPPMRLASSEPGCARDEGCLAFVPERVADRYVIESWSVETGAPLCPVDVEVTP